MKGIKFVKRKIQQTVKKIQRDYIWDFGGRDYSTKVS